MGCGAVGLWRLRAVKAEGCDEGWGLWEIVGTTARKPVQLKGSRIITGIYDIKEQRVHLAFFRPQIEPRFTLRQASPSHRILDPINLNRRTFAHPVSIIPVRRTVQNYKGKISSYSSFFRCMVPLPSLFNLFYQIEDPMSPLKLPPPQPLHQL